MTCVICGFHSLCPSLMVELLNTLWFTWSWDFSGSRMNEPVLLAIQSACTSTYKLCGHMQGSVTP